jgi:hypothetical protein
MWTWLTQTDAGLATRIAVGLVVFACLGIVDFRRNGTKATRWREYLFLFFCVAVAMLYGMINDLITSSISWEYFYYGKGLSEPLGPAPPDPLQLHLAAMIVGMESTWSAGLLVGVVLLIANNPFRNYPRLSFAQLQRMLIPIAGVTILMATALGFAGYFELLTPLVDDFHSMLRQNEMRPHHFMAVFGIHLGGYVGGGIGLLIATAIIVARRRAVSDSSS